MALSNKQHLGGAKLAKIWRSFSVDPDAYPFVTPRFLRYTKSFYYDLLCTFHHPAEEPEKIATNTCIWTYGKQTHTLPAVSLKAGTPNYFVNLLGLHECHICHCHVSPSSGLRVMSSNFIVYHLSHLIRLSHNVHLDQVCMFANSSGCGVLRLSFERRQARSTEPSRSTRIFRRSRA